VYLDLFIYIPLICNLLQLTGCYNSKRGKEQLQKRAVTAKKIGKLSVKKAITSTPKFEQLQ